MHQSLEKIFRRLINRYDTHTQCDGKRVDGLGGGGYPYKMANTAKINMNFESKEWNYLYSLEK